MSTEDKVCLVLKIVDKASPTGDIYIFPIPTFASCYLFEAIFLDAW
jgi:hypothetical protein